MDAKKIAWGGDKHVRTVRNPWAHCTTRDWNQVKFLESFKLMTNLASAISSPNPKVFDTIRLADNLDSWRDDGLRLIAKNVDPALLKKVFEKFQKSMVVLDK